MRYVKDFLEVQKKPGGQGRHGGKSTAPVLCQAVLKIGFWHSLVRRLKNCSASLKRRTPQEVLFCRKTISWSRVPAITGLPIMMAGFDWIISSCLRCTSSPPPQIKQTFSNLPSFTSQHQKKIPRFCRGNRIARAIDFPLFFNGISRDPFVYFLQKWEFIKLIREITHQNW